MDDDRKESTKGCGFLILDFLAMMLCVSLLIHNGTGLHIVFSMLIGIGFTIVFIFLTKLPYIGRLLQAGLGLVWGRIVYAFLDGVFHYKHSDIGLMTGLYENDKILWWTIVIIINLIFIAIHISAFSNHIGTIKLQKKTKSEPYSGGYIIYNDNPYDRISELKNETKEVMFSDEVSEMIDKPYNPHDN